MNDPVAPAAPTPEPASTPRASMRGLVAIALAWTVAATVLVALVPPKPQAEAGPGGVDGKAFTITWVGGLVPKSGLEPVYTVGHEPVQIVVEFHRFADVQCWNADIDDGDDAAAASGTQMLDVPLQVGRNHIECYAGEEFGQREAFTVVLDSTPADTPSPRATAQAGFRLTTVNGVALARTGPIVTVEEQWPEVGLEITGVTTVECHDLDTGELHSVGGMPGTWTVEFKMQPGKNRIECRLPGDSASAVELVLNYPAGQ